MTAADIKLFSELYRLHYTRCVRFALSYTFDEQVAEDIVSEAMLTLWNKLDGGESIERPIPFLFSIIRNGVLHHLRHEQLKQQVHQSLEDDGARELAFRIQTLEACNPSYLYSQEIQHILRQALSEVESRTRQAFVLSRLEGLTNQEIAARLGISVKGVDYHIGKCLRLLRVRLRDYLDILIFFL